METTSTDGGTSEGTKACSSTPNGTNSTLVAAPYAASHRRSSSTSNSLYASTAADAPSARA